MTTTGDIIYEASASTAARLPIGATGQVLTVTGGIPAWSTPAASSVLSTSEISDQVLSANTLVALRYAMASDAGSTAGHMWKADYTTGTNDNFYVIGLAYPGTAVSAGGTVTVTEAGLINAPSHGFTTGVPLYLGAAGALTTTPPSTSLQAVVRVGQVKDANNIYVNVHVVGVN